MLVDRISERVLAEAQGPVNRYFAWKDLGHNPDSLEALDYFLEHKGEESVKLMMGIPSPNTDVSCMLTAS
jgi:hypothetical protein